MSGFMTEITFILWMMLGFVRTVMNEIIMTNGKEKVLDENEEKKDRYRSSQVDIVKQSERLWLWCVHVNISIYMYMEESLITDHKPVEGILNKPTSKPTIRLERMCLHLQPYRMKVVYYRPGKEHTADIFPDILKNLNHKITDLG